MQSGYQTGSETQEVNMVPASCGTTASHGMRGYTQHITGQTRGNQAEGGEMSKQYIYMLTDGLEISRVKAMTPEQWRDERTTAANATGGNWNWELASILPVVEGADVRCGLRANKYSTER